ncbi:Pseudouridinemetabolizing bifunctional protein C186105like, partial [Caligus rogercresseyi]
MRRALSSLLDIPHLWALPYGMGTPVVALESTILTHGMPYPQNIGMAQQVESIVRSHGAVLPPLGSWAE